ncbi:MAG: hypothetical protein KGQ54_05275 [Verrucomicrobia bacterium]|nr:hypothetical protein [Verrucomicrobiota bacterium]
MKINPKHHTYSQHAHVGKKTTELDKKISQIFMEDYFKNNKTSYKFKHHNVTLEKAPKGKKSKRY